MKLRLFAAMVIPLALCAAFGEVVDEARARIVSDILCRTKAAEEIVVEDLSPEVRVTRMVVENGVTALIDEPPQVRRVSLTTTRELETFAAALRPSVTMLREGVELRDETGATTIIYPLCQCLGDYEFRVLQKKTEVLRFTIHHEGSFIRLKSAQTSEEFDLVPPSGKQLTEIAREALKRANQ
jgi:hypothetical protein